MVEIQMEIRKELLRQIPKVDEVLARPAVAQLAENGRSAVTQAVRQVTEGLRQGILEGEAPDVSVEQVERLVLAAVEQAGRMSLRPVINATGIVLHTNLGRAVLSHQVAQHVMEVAENYNTLEYSCEAGRRGR